MTDQKSASKADELKRIQKTNFRAFDRIISGIDVDAIEDKWKLEDKLHILNERWRAIDQLHWDIDNLLNGSDEYYEKQFTDYEETYDELKTQLNKKLNSTSVQQLSTPRVELPTFSGNYSQWPTFSDLYVETIHNNSQLTNAQKMQHLKGRLKGEAERLVQHLNISAENYKTCWEILVHRYHNIQLLFTTHIKLFMNQPQINKQTSHDLKRLHDVSMEAIHAIQNLGIDTTTWDPILVHILAEKLDQDTYSSYMESRKNPKELPSFEELVYFLEAKFTALEPLNRKPKINNFQTQEFHHQVVYANTDRKCPLCKTDHILFHCQAFRSMTPKIKLKTIADMKICKNCLYCHNGKQCNSQKRCKLCNEQHHTMLHDSYDKSQNSPGYQQHKSNQLTKPTPRLVPTSKSNNVTTDYDEVLLPTVNLKVRKSDGTFIILRALLDQGSQVTLITERAVQCLGLERQNHSGTISGVGSSANQSRGMVELYCQSSFNDENFTVQALVMIKVVNSLPNTTFEKRSWPHIQNMNLADPDYNVSRAVDILLDASVYSAIVQEGIIRGPEDAPIAQLTSMGWVVYGKVRKTYNCHVTLNNLDDITKFWEMEEITENENTLTSDDEYCEKLYRETTERSTDGRYHVRLPMKPNFEQDLGKSKPQAIAQFMQLEKRMARDDEFADSYRNFMTEYIQLNHMVKCTTPREPSCFLPHHGVIREDKTSSKLRVVFNAKNKTQSGRSLNELMLCGPNLQQDLLTLLLKWRTFQFVYTADIEKFYRQILVNEEDQSLQKIVWRCTPTDTIEEYQLRTVTYGTVAGPFLSMRTVKQLALDDGAKYPLAVDTLNNQLYMDDLLGGSNDIHTAKETQQQVINILQGAGFNLRKWASNDIRLLEHLSQEQISANMFDFRHAQSNKALGLQWNPCTDQFSFKQEINTTSDDAIITKRSFLSDISKRYDPFGYLSPITVKGKMLFQEVWASGIGWDDPVPQNIQTEWKQYTRDMDSINNITLPRHVGYTDRQVELHGYSDASQNAYACAIYCKSTTEDGEEITRLVAAKTKLAPLNKKLSIPRLELCGALLLVRLMEKVKTALQQHDTTIRAWTDSMVVLGWLQGDPSRWKTFVANRVKQINDVIPASQWRHLRSEDNPSDMATRGIYPSQLIGSKLWWEGPSSLKTKIEELESVPVPTLERKTKQTCVAQITLPTLIDELLQKYSSLTRVIHVTSWILRFIRNVRHESNFTQTMHLTTTETDEALKIKIKTVQLQAFSDDITRLKQVGEMRRKSNILNLNPFLDEAGILRVGGRLSRSNLSQDKKHPIILPSNNKFTELLIEQGHKTTLHGGAKLTLAYLRDKYWIIGGQSTVKKQIRKCVKCQRFSKQNNSQLMADLPQPRVTPSRPFTHCGVDFTGHVEVKANKGRGIKTTKGYICIFVCMATKAVHLELVSDLSSSAFLAAFKRMCSRRGMPKHMYSDQGSNFIGASRIMKKEQKEAMQQYISTDFLSHLTDLGIEWHFNAPAWPSAGGLWESAVRSMKHHLKRVIGEQKLTFEEFSTLLTQIEACLNSRPLTTLTEDCDDLEYLSPGHFLIGESLLSTPLTPDKDLSSIRNRWQLTEKMHKDFWKKWSTEYLCTLQSRQKWNKERKNLQIDDIVVIKEDNLPPAKWILGRVIELHPGRDGLVRVVTLRTKNGTMQRPIIKLTILPVHDETTNTQQHQSDPSTSDDGQNKPPTARALRAQRRAAKTGKTYLCTALLFFMSLFTPALQQAVNVTSLDSSKPVYFDKISNMQVIQDEWKLIVYYNMTTYWNSITNIENYVEHLTAMCKENTAYLTIASQFQHEIKELHHFNKLLKVEHGTRQKRGLINGIGYVANTLFGVLDDRFAEKYRQDINMIQENEGHLVDLYKQQTSIIEGEYNLLKRNEEVMNKQFLLIDTYLTDLKNKQDQARIDIENNAYITSGALAASVIIANLHRIQQSLLDVVTDSQNGRVDTHVLPPEQFLEQLNIISRQLPRELSVPNVNNRNELRELYKLLRVHTKLTEEYMLFEIKLPLTNHDQYELFLVIPIPQRKELQSVTLIPSSEYVALNLQKDAFIPLEQRDIHACLNFDETNILCSIDQPIYSLKGNISNCEAQIINNQLITQCKTEISPCSDRWIQLHNKGAWLFSCCGVCTVRIFCTGGMTARTLNKTGLISLEKGCAIKSEKFTIHAFDNFYSKLTINGEQYKLKIPDINHVIGNSTSMLFEPETHDDVLHSLKHKIDEVKTKQESTFTAVSQHDIHHYVVLYIIVAVLICLAALWIWRKLKVHRLPLAGNDNSQFGMELQTMPPTLPTRAPRPHSEVQCSVVMSDHYSVVKNDSIRLKKVDKATSP